MDRRHRSGIDIGEQVVSPFLWSRGIQHLDMVALTHAHHDHLDGLHSVLQNFRVGELWIGRDEETAAFENLLKEAHERGIRIVHEVSGSNFDWDGVTGHVLWPADLTPVNEASNDDSLVLRLEDGSVRFLLAGDIQKKVEQRRYFRRITSELTISNWDLRIDSVGLLPAELFVRGIRGR
jgi:competence protein ComEC